MTTSTCPRSMPTVGNKKNPDQSLDDHLKTEWGLQYVPNTAFFFCDWEEERRAREEEEAGSQCYVLREDSLRPVDLHIWNRQSKVRLYIVVCIVVAGGNRGFTELCVSVGSYSWRSFSVAGLGTGLVHSYYRHVTYPRPVYVLPRLLKSALSRDETSNYNCIV